MSADDHLAGIMANLTEPEPMPPGRLSRLQRSIITGIAVAIYNSNGNGWRELGEITSGHVTRSAAYEATRVRHWPTDPHRSWELQDRSHRTSFDRALATLLQRGYVNGLALAWIHISHEDGNHYEDVHGWQGSGRQKVEPTGYRSREPVLKRIGLADKGWRTVDVGGRPLGELLTRKDAGPNRWTELAFHDEIAELVASIVGGAA